MEETVCKIGTAINRDNLKRIVLQVVSLLLFPAAAVVSGAGSGADCYCNELGKNAEVWRLHLFAKNPENWRVINNGARGELTIRRSSGKFEMKASGLRPNTEYALARYDGKPPFGKVLARGCSNLRGEYSGSGIWQQWSGKFWLVPGKDLAALPENFSPGMSDELRAWHPVEYLFESEEL